VLASSVGSKQRDVEDVVDLPFPGQREADGQGGDDFLDLEGTLILVFQFLRGAAVGGGFRASWTPRLEWLAVTARSGKARDGETGQGQGRGQGQESARGGGRGQDTDKSGTRRRPRQDKDKSRRTAAAEERTQTRAARRGGRGRTQTRAARSGGRGRTRTRGEGL